MKILGIIPARHGSTRFPGKALVDIAGKSMIQRVYEQAQKAKTLSKVMVATDHAEIYRHVAAFGGNVTMTSNLHQSGTDRCAEALENENEKYDYVINIQGDEPFINPEQIDILASCFDGKTQLATLVKKIYEEQTLNNHNVVKVVFNKQFEALYFSRETIPHIRGVAKTNWLAGQQAFYKHIGIYGYQSNVLNDIARLEMGDLEKAESLEQLRWLENGYRIKVAVTDYESIGIDTPEDLEKVLHLI